jgi:hypothetical protein
MHDVGTIVKSSHEGWTYSRSLSNRAWLFFFVGFRGLQWLMDLPASFVDQTAMAPNRSASSFAASPLRAGSADQSFSALFTGRAISRETSFDCPWEVADAGVVVMHAGEVRPCARRRLQAEDGHVAALADRGSHDGLRHDRSHAHIRPHADIRGRCKAVACHAAVGTRNSHPCVERRLRSRRRWLGHGGTAHRRGRIVRRGARRPAVIASLAADAAVPPGAGTTCVNAHGVGGFYQAAFFFAPRVVGESQPCGHLPARRKCHTNHMYATALTNAVIIANENSCSSQRIVVHGGEFVG